MKVFFKKIFIFILPLIIIIILVEVMILNSSNEYSFKNNYLENKSKDLEVLVLGSSHSFRGVNPVFFEYKAFNAAYVSQSLKFDIEIFKKFKTNFKKLKFLVLPISYLSLFYEMEEGREAWRVPNYNVFYKIRDDVGLFYKPAFMNLPPDNIRKLVKLSFFKRDLEITELGFGGTDKKMSIEDLEEHGRKRAERHTFSNFSNMRGNLKRLRYLVEECKRLKINVFLFTPPTWKSYRDNISDLQYNVMKKELEDFVDDNAFVYYKDYFDSATFSNRDFKDSDHLNNSGAEKLTELINDDLKKIAR